MILVIVPRKELNLLMNNEKGYISAGKGFSFTPSRNANWIDEYNAMLKDEDVSRNKLTEKLIVLGIEAKKNNHNLNEGRKTLHSDVDSFVINSPLFSKEQIELLHTTHYSKIIESFVLQLFNSTTNAEQQIIDKFSLEQKSEEIPTVANEAQSEDSKGDIVVGEVAATVKVEENEKPDGNTKPLKKADPAEIHRLLRTFKED